MTKGDYQKLNNYLNIIFKTLERTDYYFIRYIEYIIPFCENFYINFRNQNFEESLKNTNMSILELIDITKDILKEINPSYSILFGELISSGKIDFDYKNNRRTECIMTHNNGKVTNKYIDTQRVFNLNDIKVLIHEFFHYINISNCLNKNTVLLTEFVSIYFEIYTIDYLIKKAYSVQELLLFERYSSNINAGRAFCWYDMIILAYEKFGSIDENTYKMLNQFYYKMTKEQFESECKNALYNFSKTEKTILIL